MVPFIRALFIIAILLASGYHINSVDCYSLNRLQLTSTNLTLSVGTLNHSQDTPIASEVIKNQKRRISDDWGKGIFKASRGTRLHEGLDIQAEVGEAIYAPFPGKIIRRAIPYGDDGRYEGLEMEGSGKWSKYKIKIFYAEGLLSGTVDEGQQIATAQDLTQKYPDIINHIHIEVRLDDTLIDPFELWQMSF